MPVACQAGGLTACVSGGLKLGAIRIAAKSITQLRAALWTASRVHAVLGGLTRAETFTTIVPVPVKCPFTAVWTPFSIIPKFFSFFHDYLSGRVRLTAHFTGVLVTAVSGGIRCGRLCFLSRHAVPGQLYAIHPRNARSAKSFPQI